MKSTDIRNKFFDFFIKKGHKEVASSSLIPAQDPTLLFANAGMNQFKDMFLGKEKRNYKRAVSIQKCVRAGGKHNDLDNVGFTKRHLTFFEMMGNFSFSDYFKKEAIEFAWEFLTKVMNLPAEKLHATVYKDDDESYTIWREIIGLPKDRVHRKGAEDNFWQMGETGPCGPSTEIMLDRGPEFGKDDIDNGERFLEIWNLVFMQYDRQPDGKLKPLKNTGVDTGMGLERLALIMQDKDSVFDTDLFRPVIQKIEQITRLKYEEQPDQIKAAFNVLADHIRSACLIIADGCAPSNEGRGYVLRKIIRRAALFAQKLNAPDIFPQLAAVFINDMGTIYPELKVNQKVITSILRSEIEKFAQNLVRGQHILNKYFEQNKESKIIEGDQAFKLYDTFGFPIELVQLIAQEKGFAVDMKGFVQCMEHQKQQSGTKEIDELVHLKLDPSIQSEFTGYDELETQSNINALITDNKLVQTVDQGKECWVITEHSPFFIVGGGQVPDNGWLIFNGVETPVLQLRFIDNRIAANILTPKKIQVGDSVLEKVNQKLRINAMKNHTATHLLQSALIQVLGKQIKQSGSLVHPDYLRFDFTYHQNLTAEQTKAVEDIVNEKIRQNIAVITEHIPLKEAIKKGALAFFGDKYNPEKVRLVQVADFSLELCGGTHVLRTGDIGTFKITEVSALSAGHRRVVAVTGPRALSLFQAVFDDIKSLSQRFKVKKGDVVTAVIKQQDELKKEQKYNKTLKQKLITIQLPIWKQQTQQVKNIPFLYLELETMTPQELRSIAQQLALQQEGFYFLISTYNGKSFFYALVTPKFQKSVDLNGLADWLKQEHDLKGGVSKHQLQGVGQQTRNNLLKSIVRLLSK